MANDLVSPDDMAGLPGSPFTEVELDGAVEQLRGILGWHVAPQRVETVELDVNWPARYLTLPTKRLVSVDEIRDADTGEVVPADRYRTSKHLHSVRRRSCWPRGYEAVEVDMTHGYAEIPADLLSVLAGVVRAARGGSNAPVASIGNGAYQVAFADVRDVSVSFSAQSTVDRYSLYGEVVIA